MVPVVGRSVNVATTWTCVQSRGVSKRVLVPIYWAGFDCTPRGSGGLVRGVRFVRR
jgi:hypothetical protein